MNKATKKAAIGSTLFLMVGLAACGEDADDAIGNGNGVTSVSAVPTNADDASGNGNDGTSVSAVPTNADDASGNGNDGTSVSVVLTDGDLELDLTSAEAGTVELVARNEGLDRHDVVIVKGDDPAALPVNEDGAVIESDLPVGDRIGRIDVVDAGTEESVSFDLDAGSYIIFCNIVSLPYSHFQDGMVDTFTVT